LKTLVVTYFLTKTENTSKIKRNLLILNVVFKVGEISYSGF